MEKKEFATKVLYPLKSTIFKEILDKEDEYLFISPLGKYKEIALEYYSLNQKFLNTEKDLGLIQLDFIYYYFNEDQDYKYYKYKLNFTEKTLRTINDENTRDINCLREEEEELKNYEKIISEKILEKDDIKIKILIQNKKDKIWFKINKEELEIFLKKFAFDHFFNNNIISYDEKMEKILDEFWKKMPDYNLSDDRTKMIKEYKRLMNQSIENVNERQVKKEVIKKISKNIIVNKKKIVELIYNHYSQFFNEYNKKEALYLIHSNLGWAPSKSDLTKYFKTSNDRDAFEFIDNHIAQIHYKKRLQ